MTSSHPFSSLFFELGGHGIELITCLSIVLYLARLCKGVKLEVEAGTSLICQCCEDVTSLNVVVFTRGGAEDKRANLSAAEGAVNTKVTEHLLCFVCNNTGRNKIPSGVTNSFSEETFSAVFF